MTLKKKYKGIWFYGFSGSGKTFISKILHRKIKNSVIIDGDKVRKLISTELNYSKKDREIQIKRVFGISKIIIDSYKFPIISTVYFNKEINLKCKKNGIVPVKIERENFNKIIEKHKTYKNTSNVVGKDIAYPKFKTIKINNNNTKQFIYNFELFKKLKIKK